MDLLYLISHYCYNVSIALHSNGYITLDRVIVDIGQTPTVKESGKAEARLRKHHIPNYIQALIDKNISGKKPDDPLITLSGHAIYMRWVSLLEQHDLPHMTFHDLRHLNASVMALLRIPDKYAQERGGWSSDRVMKNVYTHTFSEEREKVDVHFTELSGRHSVLERPLSEVNGRLFFS